MDISPAIYLVNNLLFIKIGPSFGHRPTVEIKYMQTGISEGIFTTEIYTESEILKTYPKAIPVRNFLQIEQAYKVQPQSAM